MEYYAIKALIEITVAIIVTYNLGFYIGQLLFANRDK